MIKMKILQIIINKYNEWYKKRKKKSMVSFLFAHSVSYKELLV